jgi:3-oxoacyl-[acyl-carrier protein] reductase
VLFGLVPQSWSGMPTTTTPETSEMNLELEGKTALVTGASSHGIGRAIAKGLAAEGVHLCLASRRRELLEELAAGIVSAGSRQPEIAAVDLQRDGSAQELVGFATRALGKIDILVNSAGGGGGKFSITDPEDKWARELTLLYTRVRQLMLAVVPGMMERKWGRIINITGKSEPRGLTGATAPKAALHGLAKGLSIEVAKYGVTVNSIAPGKILSEQILRKNTESMRQEYARREIPVGRFGAPEELASLAVFLASPRASYITGTVIPVDGGLRRYAF